MDIAAALLCTGATGTDRPCRACRGCRMVEHGNHPDLHRLEPEGAGAQIRIGDRLHPEPGSVRGLAVELSLLPVEGGARVAIVRDAQRMNDDAQSALLKTLEEPPAGTTLILCADDEERLLPTVRSRCARIRLGPVGVREIERLLAERELADPPTAARLARLAAGRAGLAVSYAMAPEAEAIRGEIGRILLDLVPATRATRLRSARELIARAGNLAAAESPRAAPPTASPARRGRAAARTSAPAAANATPPEPAATSADADGAGDGSAEAEPERKASAAERRRALGVLLDVWRGLARDLALAELGAVRSIRDVALLEELTATASTAASGAFAAFLGRLARAGELLDANVSPELVLDVLLVRWPRASR
jgi:DNA polymerase-3 subunit delta'